MAIVDPYDVATPDGGDDPRSGDDKIREHKRGNLERLANGGQYWPSGAADSDAGKHVCGEEALAAPVANDGLFTVYESNGHAGNRTTAAFTIGDGAATPADTGTLGTARGGARPYTLAVEDIVCAGIDADGAVDLSAATVTLPANLVQNVVAATGSGTVSITGSNHLLVNSSGLTTGTPAGPVLVLCTIIVKWGSSVLADVDIRLEQDTTTLFTWTLQKPMRTTAGTSEQALTVCYLDTTASDATAHDYRIEADNGGGGTNPSVTGDRQLILQEFRND